MLVSADPSESLKQLRPCAAYGLHTARALQWIEASPVTVLTSEVDLRIRRALLRVGASRQQRIRALGGQVGVERAMRLLARSVSGLECNGPLAFESYAPLAKSAIQFHDHRIRERDIAAARVETRNWTAPLRLAFSGRLTPIKGPQHVIEMARILERRGVQVEVTLFGAGEMEDQLRQSAPSNVQFAGFLPFDPSWVRRFREEVDLLIAPHPQGDPS